jgi:ferrous iron transport protein A
LNPLGWSWWRWRGTTWGSGGSSPSGVMTLATAPPGAKVVVRDILAGRHATWRLASLGIVPGVVVEVVHNDLTYPWTPIVVRVGGIEVAIGRGIASRVIVEPIRGGEKKAG